MVLRRLPALATLLALVGVLSLPLGATTTTAATGEGTATTVAGESTTTAEPIVPAVSVEVTEPLLTQPDWTYRFFIPTLLVLAALVVAATVVRYFTGVVRKRYRVVK